MNQVIENTVQFDKNKMKYSHLSDFNSLKKQNDTKRKSN